MKKLVTIGAAAAALAAPGVTFGAEPPRATLPIKEVTVFKDGHAFVLREGEMPVEPTGDVVLDDLPKPVLGTFWPYSADEKAKLTGVVAGRRPVATQRGVTGILDLIRANVGAEATFQEAGGVKWSGKILEAPRAAPAAATDPNAVFLSGASFAPSQSNLVLVETADGTKALPVERIEGVTFKGAAKTAVPAEESKDLLTLRLAWNGERAAKATVGMVYLEHGLRWIPSYRIDLAGDGRAKVRFEATLVNDLAGLEHASVHLVVGVPKFDFEDHPDPIALGVQAGEVWSRTRSARFQNAGSNSYQTQVVTMNDAGRDAGAEAAAAVASNVSGAAAAEDLFVFDLEDVSLRRGERMTLPVAEFDVTYADLCTVDVPIAPSPESLRNAGRNVEDVERLKEKVRPVAMHQVRFDNASPFPITTAPAIVLRGGRLLGQGRTCYTSPGGKCDVTVTQAVGLRVAKEEHETGRKPDALRVDGNSYCRVDLAAEIRIANDTDTARDVEVTRYVMGAVDSADHEGEKAAVNALEDVDANSAQVWGWYDQRVNSAGRIRWKIRVEPRSTVTLAYAWHYFWR